MGCLCLLLLPIIGPLLIASDPPRPADAIIVIGGDHKPERVRRAVELYQQGLAPVVIISSGTPVTEGSERLPEAEVMRRQAMALGLPTTALLIEDQSQSTFQNAYFTQRLALARDYHSILLVASAYHSRRARRIFRDVYGPTIAVWVEPAPPDPCGLCWWFQPDQAPVVAYETYNWLRFALNIRLPAEQPPAAR